MDITEEQFNKAMIQMFNLSFAKGYKEGKKDAEFENATGYKRDKFLEAKKIVDSWLN